MLPAKNKLFLIFLAFSNTVAVIASEESKVNIIQIVGCDSTKLVETTGCHSLSSVYPESIQHNRPAIVRIDPYDFSQKGTEKSISELFNNSKSNIIHASGLQTIGVLNYLCNRKNALKQQPTIAILESPRLISGQYRWNDMFGLRFLSNIQQPVLNYFSNIPKNVHIIIGSNSNLKVSDIKQSEHKHAQVLNAMLKNCGKNVVHMTTEEQYHVSNDICGCDISLFTSTDHSCGDNCSDEVKCIGRVIESAIEDNIKRIEPVNENHEIYDIKIKAMKEEGRSVSRKNFVIVCGNYIFKATLASLLAYLVYKTGIISDYLRK